jgi:hypothetical protein
MPVLAFRLATPSVLVDLRRLPGLGNIAVGDDESVRSRIQRTRALRRIKRPRCSPRYQRFESAFLQRRVCELSVPFQEQSGFFNPSRKRPQGIGASLLEEFVYDASGQPRSSAVLGPSGMRMRSGVPVNLAVYPSTPQRSLGGPSTVKHWECPSSAPPPTANLRACGRAASRVKLNERLVPGGPLSEKLTAHIGSLTLLFRLLHCFC